MPKLKGTHCTHAHGFDASTGSCKSATNQHCFYIPNLVIAANRTAKNVSSPWSIFSCYVMYFISYLYESFTRPKLIMIMFTCSRILIWRRQLHHTPFTSINDNCKYQATEQVWYDFICMEQD
jgi:hypothetical protein